MQCRMRSATVSPRRDSRWSAFRMATDRPLIGSANATLCEMRRTGSRQEEQEGGGGGGGGGGGRLRRARVRDERQRDTKRQVESDAL